MAGTEILPALAALGSAATWALGSHLFRRALARGDSDGSRAPSAAGANLYKNALAFAVFVAVFPFVGANLPDAERWPILLFSGLFGFAVGDTLYFAALPRCGVQIASMIVLVQVPASAILGRLVHAEHLEPLALFGGVAVVGGVALVLTESRSAGSGAVDARTRRFGVLLALLAALAQAVGLVVGHGAMEGVDVMGGTIARMIGGIAGAFVVAAAIDVARRGARGSSELVDLVRPWRDRSSRRGLAVAALFASVLGIPMFHYAMRGLPSGVAAVLVTTTPLFALPLGFALGERHGIRAVIGALLGFAGVIGVVLATR